MKLLASTRKSTLQAPNFGPLWFTLKPPEDELSPHRHDKYLQNWLSYNLAPAGNVQRAPGQVIQVTQRVSVARKQLRCDGLVP